MSYIELTEEELQEAVELEELSIGKLDSYRIKARDAESKIGHRSQTSAKEIHKAIAHSVGIESADERIKKKTGSYNASIFDKIKSKINNESMAHGEGRHADNDWAHNGSAPRAKVSKYHIKHKTSGKVLSTHTSAPEAVRTRAKLNGGADAYSIIKEEVMSQTYDLISAMESGKSVDMQSTFNEIMSQKITDAVDSFRTQIAGNLFKTEAVEEAVVPGSVKKDSEGHITSVKTEPDADAEARKKAAAQRMKANVGKKAAWIAKVRSAGGFVMGDKK